MYETASRDGRKIQYRQGTVGIPVAGEIVVAAPHGFRIAVDGSAHRLWIRLRSWAVHLHFVLSVRDEIMGLVAPWVSSGTGIREVNVWS